MATIDLSKEFLKHFDISSYKRANPGGQKTVFIVTIKGIKYALKILNFADERFKREVKISRQFSLNDGIPQIIKIETFESDTIIIEEYIDGFDLSEIISKYRDDEKAVCSLIFRIGEILAPIWEARFVHRDLKPQNIRVSNNGNIKVLDFGIARALDEESLTATGWQPFSWPFASPEQYAGKKDLISYRTDFFCIGIIAYNLFTNELPFGKTKHEIDKRFKTDLPKIKVNSKILSNFFAEVFHINPSERPRTIKSFLELVKT